MDYIEAGKKRELIHNAVDGDADDVKDVRCRRLMSLVVGDLAFTDDKSASPASVE